MINLACMLGAGRLEQCFSVHSKLILTGACQGLELTCRVGNIMDVNLKVEAADKDEEKRREKKKEGKEEGEGEGEGRGEKNSPVGVAEPERAAEPLARARPEKCSKVIAEKNSQRGKSGLRLPPPGARFRGGGRLHTGFPRPPPLRASGVCTAYSLGLILFSSPVTAC